MRNSTKSIAVTFLPCLILIAVTLPAHAEVLASLKVKIQTVAPSADNKQQQISAALAAGERHAGQEAAAEGQRAAAAVTTILTNAAQSALSALSCELTNVSLKISAKVNFDPSIPVMTSLSNLFPNDPLRKSWKLWVYRSPGGPDAPEFKIVDGDTNNVVQSGSLNDLLKDSGLNANCNLPNLIGQSSSASSTSVSAQVNAAVTGAVHDGIQTGTSQLRGAVTGAP